jgi:flagellar motor switch protein FliN/FliY
MSTSNPEAVAEQSPEELRQINREMIQNVAVTLAIEVGRAQIKIKDLLRLTQGSGRVGPLGW